MVWLLSALLMISVLIDSQRSVVAGEEIREFCRGQWEEDFSMQRYCMDQQNNAKAWLDSKVDLKDQEDKQVSDRCRHAWHNDHVMTKYCIEQQVQGVHDINNLAMQINDREEGQIILSKCREQWSDQFGIDAVMMAYCMKQQKQALDNMDAGG